MRGEGTGRQVITTNEKPKLELLQSLKKNRCPNQNMPCILPPLVKTRLLIKRKEGSPGGVKIKTVLSP